LIEGPKYVGKSETAKQYSLSKTRLEADPILISRIYENPNIALLGTKPRLIDE
jgi:hypothetical protein